MAHKYAYTFQVKLDEKLTNDEMFQLQEHLEGPDGYIKEYIDQEFNKK